MKILLTGGGTGGHIMPILAIVTEIRKMKSMNSDIDFMLISSGNDFNKSISDAKIQVKKIQAGKLRRYFSWKNFIDIFRIIIGFFQSLYYVYKFKPNIVFSKGGFASVPPVVVAYLLKIPILTHESDIVPGLANKIISNFADKIFISFKESEKYFLAKKTVFTGNPIREDILNGDKNRARKMFKFQKNIPTILIFGGSQGARKINKAVLELFFDILEKVQIIHICGTKNYTEIKNKISEINLKNISRYKVYPFLTTELKDAYALADIVISRGGANSLSEIIALEKPSIIIPLSTSANNHQLKNAEYYSQKGMAILLKEQDLNGENLKDKLLELLQETDFRNSIKRKIIEYKKNKKNSAIFIAEEIINLNYEQKNSLF